jgi:hypothetical protein
MSVVHSRMPLATLPQARLQNGQVGYSDVLTVPAANAATLADFVDGLGTYGMPLNPSNEPGHDHSGGMFGRPLFITVVSSTLSAGQGGTGVVYPAKYYVLSVDNAAGGVTTLTNGDPIPCWIPGCDPISGAYARMGVRLRIDVLATTLLATDTLEVIVKLNDDQYAFTVSSPNTTGVRYIGSASAAQTIGSHPGATNVYSISAKATRVAGGSARACIINVHEIEFGVFST